VSGRHPLLAAAAAPLLARCAGRTVAATGPAPAPADYAARSLALRDSLTSVLERAVRDSAFPGAYAVVGTHAGILAEASAGRLDWQPSPAPDAHTLWDMASLTKVVALTSAMIQLVEQGRVELDAPVQRYLPVWTGAG
jgi:CubicO group peptidase (beta-lactamase class C family)